MRDEWDAEKLNGMRFQYYPGWKTNNYAYTILAENDEVHIVRREAQVQSHCAHAFFKYCEMELAVRMRTPGCDVPQPYMPTSFSKNISSAVSSDTASTPK